MKLRKTETQPNLASRLSIFGFLQFTSCSIRKFTCKNKVDGQFCFYFWLRLSVFKQHLKQSDHLQFCFCKQNFVWFKIVVAFKCCSCCFVFEFGFVQLHICEKTNITFFSWNSLCKKLQYVLGFTFIMKEIRFVENWRGN